jgi:hypothetical protein
MKRRAGGRPRNSASAEVYMLHIAGRATPRGGRYDPYRASRTLESGRYATYRRPRTSEWWSICPISQAAHAGKWSICHISQAAHVGIAVDMPHIELPAEWNGRLCTPYRAPRKVAGRSHNHYKRATRYSPFVFFGKK